MTEASRLCPCGCETLVEVRQGRPGFAFGHHKRRPLEVRFWEKVEKTDSCWLWRGASTTQGYGQLWDGRYVHAHRLAYELLVGPIEDGLQIDHLCRVRMCVNPEHLEAVTQQVNVLRGDGISARNARKTHCTHGHRFTEENTYWRPGGGRTCRTCSTERARGYRTQGAH